MVFGMVFGMFFFWGGNGFGMGFEENAFFLGGVPNPKKRGTCENARLRYVSIVP